MNTKRFSVKSIGFGYFSTLGTFDTLEEAINFYNTGLGMKNCEDIVELGVNVIQIKDNDKVLTEFKVSSFWLAKQLKKKEK